MSKTQILEAIRKGKPQAVALPQIPDFDAGGQDLSDMFIHQLTVAGGQVVEVAELAAVDGVVSNMFPHAASIVSPTGIVGRDIASGDVNAPLALAAVEVAVLQGQLGVAENGAIWVDENDCVHRVLPFIAEHLVLLLSRDAIVGNMHEAYRRIPFGDTGFGVFIAGPSKTADIEQALVIGAQGARSLTAIIFDSTHENAG